MTAAGRRVVGVVLALALVVAALAPAGAAGLASGGVAPDARPADSNGGLTEARGGLAPAAWMGATQAVFGQAALARQEETSADESNGSDRRHVDPDRADQRGDLGRVSSVLVGRLSRRLGDSVLQLSQSEYQQARHLLGDRYDEDLDKLVDVAGRTQSRQDDRRAEQLAETRETQRNFTNNVTQFQETYREYRQATANGNDQRARRLGRELDRLARNIDATTDELVTDYDRMEANSSVSFAEPTQAVREIEANVTSRQQEIRQETFVETRVELDATDTSISFADPLAVSGRVVTDNGTTIPNATVLLAVGEEIRVAETDADGAFTVTYRPVTPPLGAVNATVRHVPDASSVYLGEPESLNLSVSQVTPTVTIGETTDRVRFGEQVRVAGRVTAVGEPVGGVPVVLTAGEERLARGRTATDGTYELTGPLPATIPSGERSIRVRVAQRERAIGRANATDSMRVARTPTDITVGGNRSDGQLHLDGRLTTADGRPVAHRPVLLRVDGTPRRIVRTDGQGTYDATVDAGDADSDAVRAVYSDRETNLGPSDANATIESGGGGGERDIVERLLAVLDGLGGVDGYGGRAIAFLQTVPALLMVAGLLLIALGAFIRRRRQSSTGVGHETRTASGLAGDVGGEGGTPGTAASGTAPRRLLADAEDTLAAGAADDAVEQAYRGVRGALAPLLSVGGDATHAEFLRAYERTTGDGSVDRLATLTRAYERAAFSPEGVARETAGEAVAAARALLAGGDDGERAGAAADD